MVERWGSVEIRLLGPVDVVVDGQPAALGAPKPRAVLALLALAEGHIVPIERLAAALWGEDPPDRYIATIQVYVSAIRKLFGPAGGAILVAERPGYRLDACAATVDVGRFSTLVDQAAALAATEPAAAALRYRSALGLWRGDPLCDLVHLPGFASVAAGLDVHRRSATDALFDAELASGNHAALIPELEAATVAEPLNERRGLQQAIALSRAGHHVGALRALGRLRSALRDELGLNPSREVIEVEAAILDHRPIDLHPVRPVEVAPGPRIDPIAVGGSLVGRRAELDVAVAAVADTVAGDTPLLLISGVAGIGKTRLAEELVGHAAATDVVVGWARCYEAESAAPLRPISAALADLVAAEPDVAARAFDPTDPDVSVVVPELATGAPARRRVEGEEELRLFDSVCGFLARFAAERPVVLVVDDVQWADQTSARLLDHLVRHGSDDRVMLVMTCRSDTDPTAHSTHLLETVARHRRLVRLDLTPLGECDAANLAGALLGSTRDAARAAAVAARADGIPFFIREMALHLRSDPGTIDEVPPALRSMFDRRLSALPPMSREVLALLATDPAGLPFGIARAALGGDDAGLLDALDACLRAGLLTERSEDGDVTLHFAHALYATAALEASSRPRQLHHHRVLAEAFADAGTERYPRRRAFHLWSAGRSGDPAAAAESCLAAGDQSFSRAAYRDAVVDYRRALDALGWCGAADGQRAPVLLRSAEAFHRVGDEAARRAVADEAFEAARGADDVDVMARAALVHGGARSTYGQPSLRTMELLDVALSSIQSDADQDGLRSRVGSRLAQERYHVGHIEQAWTMSEQALDLARATGDDAVIAAACEGRVWALYTPEGLGERRALCDEMVERARRASEPEWEMMARVWRCCALLEIGDVVGIDADLVELHRLSDLVRVPSHLFRISTMRSTRAIMCGDFATGFELAQQTRDIGLPIEPDNAIQTFAAQIFNMLREQGGLAGAAPLVEDLARDFVGAPGWMCALAFVRAEAGDMAGSRRLVDELSAGGFSGIQRDLAWIHAMAYLAECVAMLGAASHAEVLYPLLLPFAARNAGVFDIASDGSVAHHLGLLAATAGRADLAVAHLREAVRFNDATGQRPAAARSRVELVGALTRFGDPDDELPEVHAAAVQEIGALGLVRLEQQLAEGVLAAP